MSCAASVLSGGQRLKHVFCRQVLMAETPAACRLPRHWSAGYESEALWAVLPVCNIKPS